MRRTRLPSLGTLPALLTLAAPATLALAQEAAPAPPPAPSPQAQTPPANAPSGYVTREEYDKLQAQLNAIAKDMADMKQQQVANQKDVDDTIDQIMKDAKSRDQAIDQPSLGSNRFALVGDGEVGFTAQHHENSTFDATFSPVFLYQLDKNLLVEAALDISGSTDDTNTSSTDVTLTLANITYTVNDWLYVGGGIFAVPFGRYHMHFDPPWINKLPDDPLAFGDRALGPSSETGIYAGGAVPIDSTKLEYNAYVANGPNLIINDPTAAGSLNFDDFTDLNGNKAVGGRIGFLPIPVIDVGYSIQYSQTAPDGFYKHVDAWLQAVDAQYKSDIDAIAGTLEVRGEWIWSQVTEATYDATGALGFGPIGFRNNRNGGYAMVAYRPSKVDDKFVRNLEFVGRYDAVFVSNDAPGGGEEDRFTIGIDYWITPSVVLKTAYQWDVIPSGGGENAFFVQCGFGL